MTQKLASYELDPIKNEENAPNLPSSTKTTHLISHREENAPNPPKYLSRVCVPTTTRHPDYE